MAALLPGIGAIFMEKSKTLNYMDKMVYFNERKMNAN